MIVLVPVISRLFYHFFPVFATNPEEYNEFS